MSKSVIEKRESRAFRREKKTRPSIQYYSLLVIAFFSGAVVLLVEVLGTRILAPYLGSSFSVWVNVIGSILGFLSIGYYLGGLLADRNQRLLPVLLLVAACACALLYFERRLLPSFGALGLDWGSFVAAILLFGPPSAVLGTISPYLTKIAAVDPARIGQASGSIYAASTVGSIAGTFVGGFWLIPHFPVSYIIGGIVALLLVLSISAAGTIERSWVIVTAVLIPAVIADASISPAGDWSTNVSHLFEKNSRYYNIRVNEVAGSVRLLTIDGSFQSGRQLAGAKMPFPYIELSGKIIQSLAPNPRSVLVIGGGGYAMPEYILDHAPNADVTVVEIDPEITEVARKFFLKDPNLRVKTVNEDGRVFLNQTQQHFDVVYTDAYASGNTMPPHLATREAFYRMKQALNADGVVVFNIVSARTGKFATVYESLLRTIRDVFPTTATFSTSSGEADEPQNLILVASNGTLSDDVLRPFEASRCRELPGQGLLLTDDYSPVEHLAQDIIRKVYPEERQFQ